MKIMTQNTGSVLLGIHEIVAIAIAKPNSDRLKINFQFMFW
jgi:hypothetical protein